ncbi:hypothetical protein MASR2M36_10990 [Providencia sp.]
MNLNFKLVILKVFPILFFTLIFCRAGYSQGIANVVDCLRTSSYYQYYMPTEINVPPNVKPGDPLGPWFSTNTNTAWTCTLGRNFNTANTVYMRALVYVPYNQSAKLRTVNIDGSTYFVYTPLSIDTWGYGMVYRYRYSYLGQSTDWTAVTATSVTYPYKEPNQILSIPKDATTSPFPIILEVQGRVVKTDNTPISLTNGRIPAQDTLYFRNGISYTTATPNSDTSTQDSGGGYYMIATFRGGTVNINPKPGTCVTPNIRVPLDDTSLSNFTSIGSTGARTAFNLILQNCPPGYNAIGYQINSTTNIINQAQGVAALNPESTATGLGIQFLLENNTPLLFSTNYNVPEYPGNTTMKNYIIPLKVGLYQTSPRVTGGDVFGTFTYTVNYK